MSTQHHHQGRSRRIRLSGSTLAIGLLALIVAAVSAIASRGFGLWAKEAPKADDNPIVELAAADVATVTPAELSRVLPVTGSLSPLVQTMVKAQAPGEILEVTVREGHTVRRGDLLVRLDTRNLVADLAARQAALEKARADLSLAGLNRDKSTAMLAKKFIAQNAHDSAESAYQAAVANVKAAEAQLSLGQIALDYANVRAPFDGTVSQRLVQPGEKVEIGSNLLMLVDLSHLELQAPAPADEVPSVRVGQVAAFSVGGFGDRPFEGRVERINPMTDTGSRSVMLYLSVDNPDGVLKGGMFAQGELILDRTPPVPAIPLTAVYTEAGLPFVFVIEGAKLVRRQVTLGLRSEVQNLAELRAGLKTGDRVVAVRMDGLKAGLPVAMATAAAGDGARSSR